MDTAIITTRPVEFDAMSNFTMASAEALKKLGRVSVYSFAYERPVVEGIDVHLLGGRNGHSMGTNLRALLDTFRLAKEFSKYDVLLIVNPDVGSMPAYHMAKRYNSKLKVMWTFHGLTPAEYVSGFRDRLLMRMRKPAYAWSMRRSDRVQVFSDFIKKEVTGWGVDASKVVVVPFGIDPGRMSGGDGSIVREKYGIGDRFLLLYVGRLVNFKHVDELVRAVSTADDVCLIVVGGGPERDGLEQLSKKLQVQDRVKFAGRVPDNELPDYYAACDAWATASRHEGFCVPIVEAMAAGKPVIVPDVAAMPETAGNAGQVYRAGVLTELSDKIGLLSGDKALYSSLCGRAVERARGFSIEKVLGDYVSLVLEVGRAEREEMAQSIRGSR